MVDMPQKPTKQNRYLKNVLFAFIVYLQQNETKYPAVEEPEWMMHT